MEEQFIVDLNEVFAKKLLKWKQEGLSQILMHSRTFFTDKRFEQIFFSSKFQFFKVPNLDFISPVKTSPSGVNLVNLFFFVTDAAAK